jgi:hypothetical protein
MLLIYRTSLPAMRKYLASFPTMISAMNFISCIIILEIF